MTAPSEAPAEPQTNPVVDERPSRLIWGIDAIATGDFAPAAANAVVDDDEDTLGAPSYVGGGINVSFGARLFDGVDRVGNSCGLTAGYRLTVEYKDGIDALDMPGFYVTQRHQVSFGFHLYGRNMIEIGAGALASTGPGGTSAGYSVFFQGHLGGSRGVGCVIGLNVDVYATQKLDDGTNLVIMNMFVGVGWRGI